MLYIPKSSTKDMFWAVNKNWTWELKFFTVSEQTETLNGKIMWLARAKVIRVHNRRIDSLVSREVTLLELSRFYKAKNNHKILVSSPDI